MTSASASIAAEADRSYSTSSSQPNYYGAETLAWDSYHKVRPQYPQALFDLLFAYHGKHASSESDGWQLAADFGSGPGTIVPALLQRFASVQGSDLNERQVNMGRDSLVKAYGAERVGMHVGAAGACDWIQDGTADLLSAAEAAQWFDSAKWVAEAGRKLKSGGTLAFWYYSPNCTIVSHPGAAPHCAKLFSILFESVWASEGFPSGPLEAHAWKLGNIAIDGTLFSNETRHYWELPEAVAGPHGLGENPPSSRHLVQDVPSGIAKDAAQVHHEAQPGQGQAGEQGAGCFLERSGWTTVELMRYLESLGMPMEVVHKHPDYDATIDAIHNEVGGPQGTFTVGWWLALVMATRK